VNAWTKKFQLTKHLIVVYQKPFRQTVCCPGSQGLQALFNSNHPRVRKECVHARVVDIPTELLYFSYGRYPRSTVEHKGILSWLK